MTMFHIVSRNETLSTIARRYGVSVADLTRWNNIPNPNLVRVGEKLMVTQTAVLPAPVTPKPLPNSPFTYRVYTLKYGSRPARFYIIKFPIQKIKADIIHGRAIPSRMFKGYTVGINGSFYNPTNFRPYGRHITGGDLKHLTEPASHPAIITDHWTLDPSFDPWWKLRDRGVKHCFSAYPHLVLDGKVNVGNHSPGLGAANPRSAIGRGGDTLILMVVDGRQTHSKGVTMRELAERMLAEGATDWACNLDGGGSSQLFLNGKVVNKPSDLRERMIAVGVGFKQV